MIRQKQNLDKISIPLFGGSEKKYSFIACKCQWCDIPGNLSSRVCREISLSEDSLQPTQVCAGTPAWGGETANFRTTEEVHLKITTRKDKNVDKNERKTFLNIKKRKSRWGKKWNWRGAET